MIALSVVFGLTLPPVGRGPLANFAFLMRNLGLSKQLMESFKRIYALKDVEWLSGISGQPLFRRVHPL